VGERRGQLSTNIVEVIEDLYIEATNPLLQNNIIKQFCITAVSVEQGCIISEVMFNMCLDYIIQEPLNDFKTSFK
jgi:hypothetical protein